MLRRSKHDFLLLPQSLRKLFQLSQLRVAIFLRDIDMTLEIPANGFGSFLDKLL